MAALVVSHHVDGLELSCSVAQVRLLMQRRTDRLAHTLRETRDPCPQALPTGWKWDGDEPVMLEPFSLRKRYPYTLTCSAWALFVAPARSVLPRVVVQFRASYLRADPAAGYEETRAWVEANMQGLLDGV